MNTDGARFRPGDVLRLELPFSEVTVTRVSRFHVSVRWPWWEVDTEVEGIEWNGDVALPMPEDHRWERSYFRTEPPADELSEGDVCQAGIPPTVVHVLAVRHFDPPLETGWSPRPTTYLEVLQQGETYDPDIADQCYQFDPAGGEPYRLELLFRPYAFLETGDEVADRDGRAWRFDGPWDWHPFDGGQTGTPVWPLALLYRSGEPTPEAAAAVAKATVDGGHANELRQWAELTCAEPVALLPAPR